jgi:hypothetical protein
MFALAEGRTCGEKRLVEIRLGANWESRGPILRHRWMDGVWLSPILSS